MERACVLCNNTTITTDQLSYEFSEVVNDRTQNQSLPGGGNNKVHVAPEPPLESEGEHDRIVRILIKCSGNKAKAARLLGIDRSTLYRKMRLYNIDPTVY